ncbi:MAG: type II toxin-antitoxin system RelE/ParE family toxin [Aeromicrobium sp.]
MWSVVVLSEVEQWFLALAAEDSDLADTIEAAIDVLESEGPTLGRPLVDRIKGAALHNMKELRPSGSSVRILFVFDPERHAVLLVGGDKAGNWSGWYEKNIPVAEKRYERWIEKGE